MAFSAHKDPDQVKEHFCDEATLDKQAEDVAQLIRKSKHFIAFTGAGISTSAGIADFRGPEGVWTLRAQGKLAKSKTSVLKAVPTAGHMSLVSLEKAGYLKFLISQNTDGLHRRSGFPVDKLAELHGNANLEFCQKCKKEYFRDFKTRAPQLDVHDHRTGRKCVCGGNLQDTIINFGESLPQKPLQDGFAQSALADLCIVLGSSLTVTPAADMPKSLKSGGKLVVCNLQKTPLDYLSSIRVFAKTDDFMKKVMQKLNVPIAVWKLVRHVTIDSRIVSNSRILLTVSGVEPDGTPASILSKVRIRPESKENKVLLVEKEPFDFEMSCSSFPFKCTFEFSFMGNYNEPPLSLEFSLSEENLTKTVYRLSYDPELVTWEKESY